MEQDPRPGHPERGGKPGFFARRRADRLAAGIEEAAAGIAREGTRVYRRLEPQAKALGRTAAHEGERLLAAVLLAVLGLVFALVALLAALAFAVVALAGVLPVWAAGLIGAAALALLAWGCLRLARRTLARIDAARRLATERRRAGLPPSPEAERT